MPVKKSAGQMYRVDFTYQDGERMRKYFVTVAGADADAAREAALGRMRIDGMPMSQVTVNRVLLDSPLTEKVGARWDN